jgi:NhaC family Na+:H+ antiporter
VLHGGGIWPMFHAVLMIVIAGALNGVLERTGMMQTIISRLLERVKTTRGLVLSTVLLSIAMAMLACNQALSIIVPARALRETYQRMDVSSSLLVRSLADSGVVVSPLIPWNLHGILLSTAVGIPTAVFWPYAVYLWGLPILTLCFCLFIKNKDNSNKLDKLLQF